MLNHLNWNTLENRRNINRVTMLYKIKHNLVAIDPNLYLVKQPIMHTRNSNILQYQLFNTRTNYFKYSYFLHTVRQLSYGILCHMQHSWHPLWTNLNHWPQWQIQEGALGASAPPSNKSSTYINICFSRLVNVTIWLLIEWFRSV